jgi:hypothetical protein
MELYKEEELSAHIWIRLEITFMVDTIKEQNWRVSNPHIKEVMAQDQSKVVVEFINFYTSLSRSALQCYENRWSELIDGLKQRESHYLHNIHVSLYISCMYVILVG